MHLTALESYTPISLSEMAPASLQHRVETKFLLNESRLPELLYRLSTHYLCLEIGRQRSFQYTTNYFDTDDCRLYLDHHNGYVRRMKVRCRRYDATGESFFEIKQKINEHRSEKYRMAVSGLAETVSDVLAAQINYPHVASQKLYCQLTSAFRRSTFCDVTFTERVTIDTGITASGNNRSQAFPRLALIEVKQRYFSRNSLAMTALNEVGAIRTAFSKYALGKALLNPELKRNNFKPVLSLLAKHSFI